MTKEGIADLFPPRARALPYPVRGGRAVALLGIGAALAVVMACPAYAAYPYWGFGGGGFVSAPVVRDPPPPRKLRRPRIGHEGPEQGRTKEQAAKPPKGPLIIAVSIGEQRVRVFEGSTPIGEAPVSTGMRGHPTPMGVFSVIQKHKWHRSNIYSGAPMPYMQRITWSGVALHAGVLPGYPASHGCIRMPNEFAVRLWGMTRMGVRVIVARHGVTPVEIDNAHLALLKKPADTAAEPAKPQTRGPADAAGAYAELRGPVTADSPSPVTDAPARPVAEAGKPSTALDRPPSASAEAASAATASEEPASATKTGSSEAPKPPETRQVAEPAKPAAEAPKVPGEAGSAPSMAPAVAPEAPATALIPEKPLRAGPVSVFVSRREGKLFVRKGFEPIFDIPVTIAQRDQPLGTHVFTATEFKDDGQSLRWVAISLPTEQRAEPRQDALHGKHGRREAKPAVAAPEPRVGISAAEVLDRIDIPKEALDRIAPLLSPGASLIVSDQGLGGETGKETDFIVLTR